MICYFAALLLENIFRQLSQEAVRVSQSATVSRVIEELIGLADKAQLTVLLEQFSTDWETVCCDQFASHVTQALVKRCGHFLRKASAFYFSLCCSLLLNAQISVVVDASVIYLVPVSLFLVDCSPYFLFLSSITGSIPFFSVFLFPSSFAVVLLHCAH